eukprot:tig00000663_g2965.t1
MAARDPAAALSSLYDELEARIRVGRKRTPPRTRLLPGGKPLVSSFSSRHADEDAGLDAGTGEGRRPSFVSQPATSARRVSFADADPAPAPLVAAPGGRRALALQQKILALRALQEDAVDQLREIDEQRQQIGEEKLAQERKVERRLDERLRACHATLDAAGRALTDRRKRLQKEIDRISGLLADPDVGPESPEWASVEAQCEELAREPKRGLPGVKFGDPLGLGPAGPPAAELQERLEAAGRELEAARREREALQRDLEAARAQARPLPAGHAAPDPPQAASLQATVAELRAGSLRGTTAAAKSARDDAVVKSLEAEVEHYRREAAGARRQLEAVKREAAEQEAALERRLEERLKEARRTHEAAVEGLHGRFRGAVRELGERVLGVPVPVGVEALEGSASVEAELEGVMRRAKEAAAQREAVFREGYQKMLAQIRDAHARELGQLVVRQQAAVNAMVAHHREEVEGLAAAARQELETVREAAEQREGTLRRLVEALEAESARLREELERAGRDVRERSDYELYCQRRQFEGELHEREVEAIKAREERDRAIAAAEEATRVRVAEELNERDRAIEERERRLAELEAGLDARLAQERAACERLLASVTEEGDARVAGMMRSAERMQRDFDVRAAQLQAQHAAALQGLAAEADERRRRELEEAAEGHRRVSLGSPSSFGRGEGRGAGPERAAPRRAPSGGSIGSPGMDGPDTSLDSSFRPPLATTSAQTEPVEWLGPLDMRACQRCGLNDLLAPGACTFHPALARGNGPYLYGAEWQACRDGFHRAGTPGCYTRPEHHYAAHRPFVRGERPRLNDMPPAGEAGARAGRPGAAGVRRVGGGYERASSSDRSSRSSASPARSSVSPARSPARPASAPSLAAAGSSPARPASAPALAAGAGAPGGPGGAEPRGSAETTPRPRSLPAPEPLRRSGSGSLGVGAYSAGYSSGPPVAGPSGAGPASDPLAPYLSPSKRPRAARSVSFSIPPEAPPARALPRALNNPTFPAAPLPAPPPLHSSIASRLFEAAARPDAAASSSALPLSLDALTRPVLSAPAPAASGEQAGALRGATPADTGTQTYARLLEQYLARAVA